MRDHERNDTEYWLDVDEQYRNDAPSKIYPETPKRKAQPKVDRERRGLAEELSQDESGFDFSYHASRHEQQWISSALQEFYLDSLISDVLAMVRGGKEANVYVCQSHPHLGLDLLAAKIYRPRLLRNLKNDAAYREGRPLLGDDGKEMRDHRSLRAVHKKTRIGSEMSITSWIEFEYQTLVNMYEAGGAVPRPVAQTGNAILMEYIGEVTLPAPTLNAIRLEPEEAKPLFLELMRNVELLLSFHRVHADLSAYNVLYWEGQVTLIDFPQVSDPIYNPLGYQLLHRDVERLCQYFNTYGLGLNAARISTDVWGRYLRGELRRP